MLDQNKQDLVLIESGNGTVLYSENINIEIENKKYNITIQKIILESKEVKYLIIEDVIRRTFLAGIPIVGNSLLNPIDQINSLSTNYGVINLEQVWKDELTKILSGGSVCRN